MTETGDGSTCETGLGGCSAGTPEHAASLIGEVSGLANEILDLRILPEGLQDRLYIWTVNANSALDQNAEGGQNAAGEIRESGIA